MGAVQNQVFLQTEALWTSGLFLKWGACWAGGESIARYSERPRSLLLFLGVPSRPSPGSDPGPIQVPSPVRRGPVQIRHVLCFTTFRTHPGPEVGAIPARPGPILVPSVPSGSGLDGLKQTSWPLPRYGDIAALLSQYRMVWGHKGLSAPENLDSLRQCPLLPYMM